MEPIFGAIDARQKPKAKGEKGGKKGRYGLHDKNTSLSTLDTRAVVLNLFLSVSLPSR